MWKAKVDRWTGFSEKMRDSAKKTSGPYNGSCISKEESCLLCGTETLTCQLCSCVAGSIEERMIHENLPHEKVKSCMANLTMDKRKELK